MGQLTIIFTFRWKYENTHFDFLNYMIDFTLWFIVIHYSIPCIVEGIY